MKGQGYPLGYTMSFPQVQTVEMRGQVVYVCFFIIIFKPFTHQMAQLSHNSHGLATIFNFEFI